MADNFTFTQGSGTTAAADDISGVVYPRSKLIHGADGVNDGDACFTNPFPVTSPIRIAAASASITRPANTTAYSAGDMVANSATPGSVTPLEFTVSVASDKPAVIVGATMTKSGTTSPPTGAIFYLHLFSASPTVSSSSGDNLAFQTTDKEIYLGALQGTTDRLFDDGFWGEMTPLLRSRIAITPASGTAKIYGLVEIRGALTPVSGEVFTFSLNVE